jgi:hypothetical protein
MKFGLFKYQRSVNLGDQIQSLAARQFLPSVDVMIDRDDLPSFSGSEEIRIIANGWYMHDSIGWPPANDSLHPLFVSVHVAKEAREFFKTFAMVAYLKRFQPIGCRDYDSCRFLRSLGVEAYFSGCMTLTLQNPLTERGSSILLVDCPAFVKECIPSSLHRHVELISHEYSKDLMVLKKACKALPINIEGLLLRRAEALLERYRKARVVVSPRLHCVMPCLALGTPVLFLPYNHEDIRFGGLMELANSISLEELRKNPSAFPWECPTPNPQLHLGLREALIDRCKKFIGS